MSHVPLRSTSPLGGSARRRMVVVLIAVTAGMLVALPGTASAHVAKAHRASFRHSLNVYHSQFYGWESQCDTLKDELTSIRDQMLPLIGSQDPSDQQQLQALETAAQTLHDINTTWLSKSRPNIDKDITTYYVDRLTWFKSKADRTRSSSARARRSGRQVSMPCSAPASASYVWRRKLFTTST